MGESRKLIDQGHDKLSNPDIKRGSPIEDLMVDLLAMASLTTGFASFGI